MTDEQLKKTIEKENKALEKAIKKYRKYIPDGYNTVQLADYLGNPNVDLLTSITNRADGKSFNYIGLHLYLAIKLDIKFLLVARHWTIRFSYAQTITDITTEIKHTVTGRKLFDPEKLIMKSTDEYIIATYDGKTVGVITDLNNVTDLKYHSSFLKKLDIIIYDEFLALKTDYLPDEYERIQVLYETIDRTGRVPYINVKKVLLLGNAVNFDSPLLAGFDLYEILEKHKINTVKAYDNIALEMHRNEHANEKKNTRLFKSDDDAMNTAQFEFNRYNIASNKVKAQMKRHNMKHFYIGLADERNSILKVSYDDNMTIILKADYGNKPLDFTMHISDIKDGVTYLDDKFFSERHERKHVRGVYLYDNSYTKGLVTSDYKIASLKIGKCVGIHRAKNKVKQIEYNEETLKDNLVEDTKKSLFKKFFIDTF